MNMESVMKWSFTLRVTLKPGCVTNDKGSIKSTHTVVLYSHLRNSMNERTHFFIKIYLSHFIFERVDVSVVCERWVERHILRERTSSSHIYFREPGDANPGNHLQAVSSDDLTPLTGCLSRDQLRFSVLCLYLTAWFLSGGLLPVTHLFDLSALIVLSCLLITTWQLVKAHGVTWNKPKIQCICYITVGSKNCNRIASELSTDRYK